VALWQEVLNVEKVGTKDSFFNLGGHSLLATRAINRIANEFGVRLSLMMFFETPTVAEIASYIAFTKGGNQEEDDNEDFEEFIL